jgi:Raf kinase inhibitor-like YbhB/YbcL family protein
MKINTAFEQDQEIPVIYTCLGRNISPPFTLNDVPDETKSFVLVFEDLDAGPDLWTHWLVFNIPAYTVSVEEGHIPYGATEGLANNHTFGYEGPCPRYFKGIHHYRLCLFAIDQLLNLPAASEKEDVMRAMDSHVIDKALITGICTSR